MEYHQKECQRDALEIQTQGSQGCEGDTKLLITAQRLNPNHTKI